MCDHGFVLYNSPYTYFMAGIYTCLSYTLYLISIRCSTPTYSSIHITIWIINTDTSLNFGSAAFITNICLHDSNKTYHHCGNFQLHPKLVLRTQRYITGQPSFVCLSVYRHMPWKQAKNGLPDILLDTSVSQAEYVVVRFSQILITFYCTHKRGNDWLGYLLIQKRKDKVEKFSKTTHGYPFIFPGCI